MSAAEKDDESVHANRQSQNLLPPARMIVSGLASCRAWADDGPVETVAGLFENDVLADNVFGLQEATKRLPVEARYEILKSHVLPGKLHREFVCRKADIDGSSGIPNP